jgi:uncharacterized protein (TIGR02246 family)
MNRFLVVSAFGRNISVAAAILLTATVASAQTKPGGADDAAIAKTRTAFQTAAGTQDGAAIAKLFTADGVEMPPNAPAAKGRAAIEAYHKGFGQQWMMHGMTITSTETKVAGDTAYDAGSYKQQIMSNKSGAVIDDVGKYIVLLKKDAGGNWLITHAIYNSNLPLPAPPAVKK